MTVRTALCAVAIVFASGPASAGFDEAMLAYRARRFADAAAGFEQLTAAQPGYHYGHFMVGICRLQEGRLDDAVTRLERAITLDGTVFVYRNALADAHRRAGRLERALVEMARAAPLATSPAQTLTLRRSRGSTLARLGRCAEAIDDLAAAQAFRAEPATARELGHCQLALHDAEAARRTLASLRGDPRAAPLLAEAHIRLARAAGSATATTAWSAAAAAAEHATDLVPDDPIGWLRLGQTQMSRRRYRDAAKALTQALKLDPSSCTARINLGKCLLAVERWQGAVATLTPATRCGDQAGRVHEAIGFAELKRGRLQTALRHYETAHAITPSPSIAAGVELVRARMVQERDKAAMRAVDQAAEDEYQKRLLEFEQQEKKRQDWGDRDDDRGP